MGPRSALASAGRLIDAKPDKASPPSPLLIRVSSRIRLDAFMQTPLSASTDLTLTDAQVFRALIAQVRANGYATTVDQLALGVTSIAVPVRLNDQVVAAVNSSGYTGRLTPELLVEQRLDALRELAAAIEGVLRRNPALLNSLIGAAPQ